MRIGLIGFGSIAEHGHLPAWNSFPGVEVVAIADVSEERCSQARRLPGVDVYRDPFRLVAGAEIDCLDICSPPASHADLLIAACCRGIPAVVCEKPFVLSVKDFERVHHAAEEFGTRLVSVDNWRYSDLDRHVSAVLSSGAIGAIERVVLRTRRSRSALGIGGWNPRWRTDLSVSGGGIVLDHGWHQIYLVLGWIGTPVKAVSARTRTVNPDNAPVEDEAVLDLHFAGAMGRIELSWTAQDRGNDGVIEGTEGRILVQDDRIVAQTVQGAQELPFEDRLTVSSYHPEWFRKMFQRTILDGNSAEAARNLSEAGQIVRIVDAAYRSASQSGSLMEIRGSQRELVGILGLGEQYGRGSEASSAS